ncbi:hypothetical protein DFH09DRAFT_165722 [Mycena vulgaris]|nr:hypothetical protein DFH09DRAFT_165722 [Mycena vulgaris]
MHTNDLFAIQTLARSKMDAPRPAVDTCRSSSYSFARYFAFGIDGAHVLWHKIAVDTHTGRTWRTRGVSPRFRVITYSFSLLPSRRSSSARRDVRRPWPLLSRPLPYPQLAASSRYWRICVEGSCALGLGLAAHGPLFFSVAAGQGRTAGSAAGSSRLWIWALGNEFCGE